MSFKPFTCPACGADFEVRERLDDEDPQVQPGDEQQDTPAQEQTVPCPNCGNLVEAAKRRPR